MDQLTQGARGSTREPDNQPRISEISICRWPALGHLPVLPVLQLCFVIKKWHAVAQWPRWKGTRRVLSLSGAGFRATRAPLSFDD